VSGEIVLEKLIDTLMRIAIEHAGAERGLLILPRGVEQRIEAEATTSGDRVIVRLLEASAAALPESILHYVVRTQESVILDDASARNPFSADTYIHQHHARSILCLPLINQKKLIGVLYLENNLTPHVFTPARIAVLKLLASQAAISLENTRLYHDLEERETKIRRLVDANIVGICIFNLEGRIVEANDAFLHMVEYGREDVVSGRVCWTDLTPAEWRPADEQAVAQLTTTGSFQPFEKEYFRKDGGRVPVLVGAAMFEGSGNEGVAFVLDLSEQKRAEEALRRSQSYLAEAQSLTHTGSWAGNIVTREILHSSEEHTRLYGFDPDSGLPSFEELRQRVHPEDRDRIVETLETADRAGTDADVQFRIVLPDGTTRYVHAVGHPVFTPSGARGEFAGILMDVTERRRADEERERLRQARADLTYLSRVTTMGELTASLAHEIRQPITAAMTSAKTCLRWLGRDEPDVDRGREAASRMVKDVTRAADIISSISVLFKKGALPREFVDVNELIREMMVMLRSEANRYSIAIRTELDPDLPKVVAERVQLQQVFMNLMLNGIDAMKETSGENALTIRSELDNGQLVISLRDTGVGLPPEQADQVFRAFFTTKDHGTGMGLPISRSIIESHGGRLWATGNSGRGATFQFSLPAAAAARA
jgi:PAS domain S-box-containing protein